MRGGAGRYYDPLGSTNSVNLSNERRALSPLGTGRTIVSGSNYPWNGGFLNFQNQPTSFTGAQLIAILGAIRADLLTGLDSGNRDYALRNIDRSKEATNLVDPSYEPPSGVHLSLGLQRELAPGLVVSADLVLRQFAHTFIPDIDYNRWNSQHGPVIPRCTPEQRTDPVAVCSNGPITFDTTIGRARYRGVLLRAEERFSGRTQFLASYALSSYAGTNGTTGQAFPGTGFNLDKGSENYGPLPTDRRHVLSVSGSIELPWQCQVAISVSASSRPPFSAYVAGIDFNGDGTQNDLLPGTAVNQFGRGLDGNDLAKLVDRYNQRFAGSLTAGGQIASELTLPIDYRFNDNFFTQDVRVTRTVSVGHGRARVLLMGEAFNLFNTANLVQYSGNLANPAIFGHPGARFSQVFGSGGPRAFQLGARVTF